MSKLPELGDEGVPAYLIRAQAEKLAERLAELHKSIESNANDQEEIQKNIVDSHYSVRHSQKKVRSIYIQKQ